MALRNVKVTYSNGEVITTSMASHLSDKEIKDYFKVGKSFNIGKGGKDKMAKVKSVEILDEENECYIEFLNKKKGFQKDTKYFNSIDEAKEWAKENLGNFNMDMIKYKFEKGGNISGFNYTIGGL